MDKTQYKPVPLDLRAELAQAMRRPGFKEAWDALEEEYSALSEMLKAKQTSGVGAGAGADHMEANRSTALLEDPQIKTNSLR